MEHRFFLSEENMGDIATRENAETMVKKLSDLGWNVQYGDSIHNRATEQEEELFNRAFDACLNTEHAWMVLRRDVYGPEALN